MNAITASINEYWNLIQTHGIVNFTLLLVSIYFVPFAFKSLWWMVKNLLGPIFRVLFNDIIESKIKHVIGEKLSQITGQTVVANDIPHLESDYLYLYKIVLLKEDTLTIEFNTILIRVRFWRLIGKIMWNDILHLSNKQLRDVELKNILSKEVKEIYIENPAIIWHTDNEDSCPECSANPEKTMRQHTHNVNAVLNEFRSFLQQYNLHFVINRGSFKFNIGNTYYGVENVGGYIHNDSERFQLYINGLYDGQIISFANEDIQGYRYHLVVPGFTMTSSLWEIITVNISSLQRIQASEDEPLGRITDLHCRFSIENTFDLQNLDWQIRDGKAEYSSEQGKTYKINDVDGSFHVSGLRNFNVSHIHLDIDNQLIGCSGKIFLDKPLNSRQNLKANSGSFIVNNITMNNKVLDYMLPKKIDGTIAIDDRIINVEALINDSIKFPFSIKEGKFCVESADILNNVKEKLRTRKNNLSQKFARLNGKVLHRLSASQNDSETLSSGSTESAENSKPAAQSSIFHRIKGFFTK